MSEELDPEVSRPMEKRWEAFLDCLAMLLSNRWVHDQKNADVADIQGNS